jgi:hypothetical protein
MVACEVLNAPAITAEMLKTESLIDLIHDHSVRAVDRYAG